MRIYNRKKRAISLVMAIMVVSNSIQITGLAEGEKEEGKKIIISEFQELPEELSSMKVPEGTSQQEFEKLFPDTLMVKTYRDDAEEQKPEQPTSAVTPAVPDGVQKPSEGEMPEENLNPSEGEKPGEPQNPSEGETPGENQRPSEGEKPGENQGRRKVRHRKETRVRRKEKSRKGTRVRQKERCRKATRIHHMAHQQIVAALMIPGLPYLHLPAMLMAMTVRIIMILEILL